VGVDAAREEEEAGCVDEGVTLWVDAGVDFADFAILYKEIGGMSCVSVDNGAVLNKCAHMLLLSSLVLAQDTHWQASQEAIKESAIDHHEQNFERQFGQTIFCICLANQDICKTPNYT
jgi:hypothetical protein